MGRFAERFTQPQRDAAARAVLDEGRRIVDIYRDGIPGVLEPHEMHQSTVATYVRKEKDRRALANLSPGARGPLHQASEDVLRRALHIVDLELRTIEDQRKTRDVDRLARLVDTGVKIHAASNRQKPAAPTPGPPTKPTKDEPATLADRLAQHQAPAPSPSPNGTAHTEAQPTSQPPHYTGDQDHEQHNANARALDGDAPTEPGSGPAALEPVL